MICVLGIVTSETVFYRDTGAVISDTRQFVSLGGLFPVRKNAGNQQCAGIQNSGVERVEAMVFAIRSINNITSVLPNVTLTFNIRDTCSIPNIGLEEALEYVHGRDTSCSSNKTDLAISGVIGSALSSVSIHVAGLLRLFQVPQISYASTADILSDKSRHDYFFRTIPSDHLQAQVMADLIEHFNWTYIFALYSLDTYGRDGIDSLINELSMRSGSQRCIALKMALPLGRAVVNEDEYNRVADMMNQDWIRNASVAVLFGHTDQADGIIRALSGTSLRDVVWIASDAWALYIPTNISNQVIRTILGVTPRPGPVSEFENYLTGLTTDNPWFDEYSTSNNISIQAAYIIDAVYAFAHAIHQMVIDHCQNGILCSKILVNRTTGEAVNGEMLREYLFNVSFPSTYSDDILFDSNGDVKGSYLIVNLRSSLEYSTVATWNCTRQLEIIEDIEWNMDDAETDDVPQSSCSFPCEVGHYPEAVRDQAQCCHVCKPCQNDNEVSSGEICYKCETKYMPNSERSACVSIPLTYFTWSNPWAISVLVLTCIGIIATVFVVVVYILFYKNRVIKASSRELVAVLLGGILLCYLLPFFFIGKPSLARCGIRRLTVGLCFAISYSPLLVRANRIHRIFNHPVEKLTRSPRFVGTVSQLVFTFILVSIQVVIAVIWLAVEIPSVDEILLPDNRTVELKCGESPYFGLPVSLGYNFLLLLFSIYFAFCTRKVPDNFNEMKFINVTVYTLCIIWIGFIPTYFVTIRFGTIYENFFLLLAILLSASTTLICLLIPKIIFVIIDIVKSKKTTVKSLSSSKITATSLSGL